MSENDQSPPNRYDRLRSRLRQLILMRETGPKSAAWHRARTNLIWRLHREMDHAKPHQDEQQDK